MTLPFTVEQFLEVFRVYNLNIWPVQIIAYILLLGSVALAFTQMRNKDRIISTILSFSWVWNGIAYHMMSFAGINKAAYIFGTFFAVQGLLIFYYGALKNKITFNPADHPKLTIIGCLFIIYAAVIYPVIGNILGHGYPFSPLLGVAPCPTTIFTFGLLLLAASSMTEKLIPIPLLWSLIGSNAAWTLGIWGDLGLLASGLVSTAAIGLTKYINKREGSARLVVEK